MTENTRYFIAISLIVLGFVQLIYGINGLRLLRKGYVYESNFSQDIQLFFAILGTCFNIAGFVVMCLGIYILGWSLMMAGLLLFSLS